MALDAAVPRIAIGPGRITMHSMDGLARETERTKRCVVGVVWRVLVNTHALLRSSC